MTETTTRNTHLREILSGRRRELQDYVQCRIRDGRTDRPNDVLDELERTDANISEEVELALLQLKAQTLSRIDEALHRLDAGEYGCCFECSLEISETRLRALPFAVRCKACEERREQGQAQTRRLAQEHASLSPFQR
jgi:DnaK suppressor protein